MVLHLTGAAIPASRGTLSQQRPRQVSFVFGDGGRANGAHVPSPDASA
jgi:hypothetical protein